MTIFFKEPLEEDPTWLQIGETVFEWLNRSTVRRATACRLFINTNLSLLPIDPATEIFQKMEHQWRSAFFELIVARFLQELGAQIEYESQIETGRRIDFTATFGQTRIRLEATSPDYNISLKKRMAMNDILVNILKNGLPEGWLLYISELPNINQSDSQKEFKAVTKSIMQAAKESLEEHFSVTQKLSSGYLILDLRKTASKGGWQVGPSYDWSPETSDRVLLSVKNKKRQIRKSSEPLILVVRGPDMEADHTSFDNALFGTEGNPERSGALRSEIREDSNFAGVMIFKNLGWTSGQDPIFYQCPRYIKLPEVLNLFERRFLDDTGSISCSPSSVNNFLNRHIEFVPIG